VLFPLAPLGKMRRRAEVPHTSRFKHLQRQPALTALNDTFELLFGVAL
jgi:hypothetical protein